MRKSENNISDQVTELQAKLLPHLKIMDRHIEKGQALVATPKISILENVFDMNAQVGLENIALDNLKEECENLLASLQKTHKHIFDKL